MLASFKRVDASSLRSCCPPLGRKSLMKIFNVIQIMCAHMVVFSNATHANCNGKPFMDLPFAGGPYIVSQGNHGDTSHYDHGIWDNTYAIDIDLPMGTPLLAPVDGTVTAAYGVNGSGCLGGGRVVVIKDDAIGTSIVLLHLSQIIKISGAVKRGDLLGYSGSSSGSRGVCNEKGFDAHLHIHLWNEDRSPDSHTKPWGKNFQLRVKEKHVERCLHGGKLHEKKIVGREWASLLVVSTQ